MKYFFVILTLASISSSCGKSKGSSYDGPSNVLKNWVGRYESPSFADLKLNRYENSSNYLICNGSYPPNPSGYNSSLRALMTITASSENEGTIGFGVLPYVGASNTNCQALSQQILDYKISGNRLLVCFRAPNQNICLDYTERD